uniref:Uncharacterized protein n=1 Tax=Rinkaby virus TaxID=2651953 RepID=A0A5Q0TW33_9VIRU|nr:hypothetical protein [Rinkaby virus]
MGMDVLKQEITALALDNTRKGAIVQRLQPKLKTKAQKDLSKFDPVRTDVKISCCLTPSDQVLLERGYPELRLEFTQRSSEAHAFAHASRTCEMFRIKNFIRRNGHEVLPDGSFSFIDVGGNEVTHALHSGPNTHTCYPENDIRNLARSMERQELIKDLIMNSDSAETAAHLRKYLHPTRNICSKYSERCDAQSYYSISIHAIQDFWKDLIPIMVAHGNTVHYASFMYTPNALFEKRGVIRHHEQDNPDAKGGLNARWQRHMDGDREMISFTFNNDPSIGYDQDYETYVELLTKSVIVQNGRIALIERKVITHGICFMKITLLENSPQLDQHIKVVSGLPMGELSEMYLILGYHTDDAGKLRPRSLIAPKILVDKLTDYCARIDNVNFNLTNLFHIACSLNRQLVISGHLVLIRSDLNTEELYFLCLCIYVYMYNLKYEAGLTLKNLVNLINETRALRTQNIAIALSKKVMHKITFGLFKNRKQSVDTIEELVQSLDFNPEVSFATRYSKSAITNFIHNTYANIRKQTNPMEVSIKDAFTGVLLTNYIDLSDKYRIRTNLLREANQVKNRSNLIDLMVKKMSDELNETLQVEDINDDNVEKYLPLPDNFSLVVSVPDPKPTTPVQPPGVLTAVPSDGFCGFWSLVAILKEHLGITKTVNQLRSELLFALGGLPDGLVKDELLLLLTTTPVDDHLPEAGWCTETVIALTAALYKINLTIHCPNVKNYVYDVGSSSTAYLHFANRHYQYYSSLQGGGVLNITSTTKDTPIRGRTPWLRLGHPLNCDQYHIVWIGTKDKDEFKSLLLESIRDHTMCVHMVKRYVTLFRPKECAYKCIFGEKFRNKPCLCLGYLLPTCECCKTTVPLVEVYGHKLCKRCKTLPRYRPRRVVVQTQIGTKLFYYFAKLKPDFKFNTVLTPDSSLHLIKFKTYQIKDLSTTIGVDDYSYYFVDWFYLENNYTFSRVFGESVDSPCSFVDRKYREYYPANSETIIDMVHDGVDANVIVRKNIKKIYVRTYQSMLTRITALAQVHNELETHFNTDYLRTPLRSGLISSYSDKKLSDFYKISGHDNEAYTKSIVSTITSTTSESTQSSEESSTLGISNVFAGMYKYFTKDDELQSNSSTRKLIPSEAQSAPIRRSQFKIPFIKRSKSETSLPVLPYQTFLDDEDYEESIYTNSTSVPEAPQVDEESAFEKSRRLLQQRIEQARRDNDNKNIENAFFEEPLTTITEESDRTSSSSKAGSDLPEDCLFDTEGNLILGTCGGGNRFKKLNDLKEELGKYDDWYQFKKTVFLKEGGAIQKLDYLVRNIDYQDHFILEIGGAPGTWTRHLASTNKVHSISPPDLQYYKDVRCEEIFKMTFEEFDAPRMYDSVFSDAAFATENESLQADEHYDLFAKIVTRLPKLLRKGGNFILKVYASDHSPTVSLLEYIAKSFRHCEMVKPPTSMVTNSESYLVGMGYLEGSTTLDVSSYFLDLLNRQTKFLQAFIFFYRVTREKRIGVVKRKRPIGVFTYTDSENIELNVVTLVPELLRSMSEHLPALLEGISRVAFNHIEFDFKLTNPSLSMFYKHIVNRDAAEIPGKFNPLPKTIFIYLNSTDRDYVKRCKLIEKKCAIIYKITLSHHTSVFVREDFAVLIVTTTDHTCLDSLCDDLKIPSELTIYVACMGKQTVREEILNKCKRKYLCSDYGNVDIVNPVHNVLGLYPPMSVPESKGKIGGYLRCITEKRDIEVLNIENTEREAKNLWNLTVERNCYNLNKSLVQTQGLWLWKKTGESEQFIGRPRKPSYMYAYTNKGLTKVCISVGEEGGSVKLFSQTGTEKQDFLSIADDGYYLFYDELHILLSPNLVKQYDTVLKVFKDDNYMESEVVSRLLNCEIKLVQGCPGCGKTTYIIEHHAFGDDCICTQTKEARQDVVNRVIKKFNLDTKAVYNVKKLKELYRTLDSLIVNPVELTGVRLFADEAMMAHAADLLVAIALTGCKEVICVGDLQQIPYINRVAGYNAKHFKLKVNVHSRLDVTHRCPKDVVRLLNPHYERKLTGTNPRDDTMSTTTLDNIEMLPIKPGYQYLVFTQDEKNKLIEYFKKKNVKANVMSVHESQGSQFSDVIIVRTNIIKSTSTFSSLHHIIVAVSRHTTSMQYILVGIKTDMLSTMIKNNLRSNMKSEGTPKLSGGASSEVHASLPVVNHGGHKYATLLEQNFPMGGAHISSH